MTAYEEAIESEIAASHRLTMLRVRMLHGDGSTPEEWNEALREYREAALNVCIAEINRDQIRRSSNSQAPCGTVTFREPRG